MRSAFLLAAGLAWQSVSPEVVQHVQAGLAAQKQGRMNEAITEFRRVTELAPGLAAAFVNLGAAYFQTRNYGSAIPPLKRALELNPDLPGAHQMLGYALLAQGYAAEAIPHLERTQTQDALGIAQLKTGRLNEAIANLQAALQKHPNDPDLLYYLGQASGLLSRATFDTLLSNYPDSAFAHEGLGDNYAALRRVPEAEKEYREALRLNPGLPGAHLALGQVYAGASQWTKAEEEFRAEAKLQPGDAEPAFRLGSALLQNGKLKEAQQELERADSLRPEMPETLYSLGKAASLNGNAALAEKTWNELLRIDHQSSLAAQAHFGLATLYRKQGKPAQAEREMQLFQALQKSSGPPQK